MDRTVLVEVEWDAEAEVWIASCEALGLFTESDTLDGMRRRVPLIASDLLEEAGRLGDRVRIELRVKLDETVSAAA